VVNFVVAAIKSTIVAIAVVYLVITAIIAIPTTVADYFLVSLQHHSDHAIKAHFLSKKTSSL
jgi:hypothetical protein